LHQLNKKQDRLMRIVRLSAFYTTILCIIIGTGCSGSEKALNFNASYDPSKGYIYGRFVMENYYEKAVVISLKEQSTGERVNIKFDCYTEHSRPREISVYQAPPGTYVIDRVYSCTARRSVFTFRSADCSEHIDFAGEGRGQYSAPFTVNRGETVYIGDFTGLSFGTGLGEVKWEIRSIENRFTTASEKLKELYRGFSNVIPVNAFRGM